MDVVIKTLKAAGVCDAFMNNQEYLEFSRSSADNENICHTESRRITERFFSELARRRYDLLSLFYNNNNGFI